MIYRSESDSPFGRRPNQHTGGRHPEADAQPLAAFSNEVVRAYLLVQRTATILRSVNGAKWVRLVEASVPSSFSFSSGCRRARRP
jgi:hypothetical protein